MFDDPKEGDSVVFHLEHINLVQDTVEHILKLSRTYQVSINDSELGSFAVIPAEKLPRWQRSWEVKVPGIYLKHDRALIDATAVVIEKTAEGNLICVHSGGFRPFDTLSVALFYGPLSEPA